VVTEGPVVVFPYHAGGDATGNIKEQNHVNYSYDFHCSFVFDLAQTQALASIIRSPFFKVFSKSFALLLFF